MVHTGFSIQISFHIVINSFTTKDLNFCNFVHLVIILNSSLKSKSIPSLQFLTFNSLGSKILTKFQLRYEFPQLNLIGFQEWYYWRYDSRQNPNQSSLNHKLHGKVYTKYLSNSPDSIHLHHEVHTKYRRLFLSSLFKSRWEPVS